jgi:ABC-type oligopeptide transport system substrate-binding subunit
MKKTILILSLFAFLSACGPSTQQNSNTHTHDDGTVHSHEGDDHAPANQESFIIEDGDTLMHDDHDHDHDHDHEHPHKH